MDYKNRIEGQLTQLSQQQLKAVYYYIMGLKHFVDGGKGNGEAYERRRDSCKIE